MGFLSKSRRRLKNLWRILDLSINDPKAWNPALWNIGGVNTAGETVTEETALTYSAFWNAVNLISGTVATLPLHLMRPIQPKGAVKFTESNLYTLMHDKWNPFMTAYTGRKTICAHVLTWGNGYAEKVYDGMRLRELWPIPPSRVKNIVMDGGKLVYEIIVDGEEIYIPQERMLHLRGLGNDGFVGYSVVGFARKSLGLSMAMETFGGNFFEQGMNPGAVLKHPNKVGDIKKMREAFTDVYAGIGKTHRLMLLEEGMDFEKIGMSLADATFLESRTFQIPEIARWFNLPPHKLKDLTKSSFNNIEQEQISYVVDSILPWLINFEQEYNVQLLTDSQMMREGLYFNHVVEGLLRADSKSRAEFYQIMRRNGFMTMNEVREREDLNPIDDPLADELWTEVNLSPLSKYDEMSVTEPGQEPQTALPEPQQNLIELNINGQKLIGGQHAHLTEDIRQAKAK